MKKMKKLLTVVLATVMALSCLSTAALAVSGDVPADIIEMSSHVAVELEQEGIVLLKNEDNILPLDGKKLNIFGVGAFLFCSKKITKNNDLQRGWFLLYFKND